MLRNAPAVRIDHERILQTLPDTLLLVDRKGLIQAHLGAPSDRHSPLGAAEPGLNLQQLWPEKASDMVRLIRRTLTAREPQNTRLTLRDESRADDANDRRYEVRMSVFGREQVLLVLRDVTGATTQQGAPGARVDPATGLPTRERFIEQLADCIGQAHLKERALAVLHIDIDDFANVFQSFGRDVADALLSEVAVRLKDCLRACDHVSAVGRGVDARRAAAIGGAGFGVILTDVDRREYASDVAARASTAFMHYFNVMGQQIRLTPSVGIALYPKDARDADSLVKAATAAVAEARMHSTHGQQFYSETIPMRAEKRLDLGAELRWAIEHEQLDLHYQPRFSLPDLQLVAVDALLRWEHPVRGFVPMEELIPLAETTGVLQSIGNWVLREACEQLKRWQAGGHNAGRVSVNLARQQLSCDQLSERVLNLLQELDLPGDCLELELTEQMLLKVRGGHAQLLRLQQAGVAITLDSFGTGYSSLQEFCSLPLKAVKIDRAFVTRLESSPEAESICTAASAVARAFGLRVMAEGVESLAQLEHMRALGCDEVQGFLLSKPLPASQLVELFERQARGEPSVP